MQKYLTVLKVKRHIYLVNETETFSTIVASTNRKRGVAFIPKFFLKDYTRYFKDQFVKMVTIHWNEQTVQPILTEDNHIKFWCHNDK